jgi:hypothetical protein
MFSEIICLTELLHGRNVPNITLSKKFGIFVVIRNPRCPPPKDKVFTLDSNLFDSDEKNPVNS